MRLKELWTLASELLLEPGPPFSSLNAHRPPQVADGEPPYSHLLDPRWAEVSLAHLKETGDYLLKRRNVGKFVKNSKEQGQEESTEAEPKRQPRPKPKARSQAAAMTAEG